MTTKSAYDWVSYVEKAILDLDDIPLLGQAPVFPWETFTEELSHFFGIHSLKIKPLKWHWFSSETLLENFGEDTTCLSFSVLPLQGKVSLLLPAMDVNSLVAWLTEKKAGTNTVMNSQLTTGLLAFVSVETLHHLQPKPFFDGFLLRFVSDSNPPSMRALGLDIQMEAYGESLTCRLLIPEIFRKNWITHFLQRPRHISIENQKSLMLLCALEAGCIRRSRKEWKEVRPGDFIPIENCQVDPDKKTGSLHLTLEGKPLFRVRVKEKGVKILEQPIYEEEFLGMDDETELPEAASSGVEESVSMEASESEALDTLDSPEDIEEKIEVKEEKPPFEQIEKVPLNISIELTRFKMTCGKLMQLKPGNLVELNLQLEKPVDLVVNGKKIAEGELIRVGETLGVRILNIG